MRVCKEEIVGELGVLENMVEMDLKSRGRVSVIGVKVTGDRVQRWAVQ
jgi:hypothetical protein